MEFLKFEAFVNELSFENIINESNQISADSDAMQLIDELKSIYKKEFPKSHLRISFRNTFGGIIAIRMMLADDDKSEWLNGIIDNDMLIADFMIDGFDQEGNAIKPLEFINTRSGFGFYTKPDNKYMVYGRHKIRFRKSKGDTKKISAAFKKTVQKLKSELQSQIDNFHYHYEPMKAKLK